MGMRSGSPMWMSSSSTFQIRQWAMKAGTQDGAGGLYHSDGVGQGGLGCARTTHMQPDNV
jgi:hypothetical protein